MKIVEAFYHVYLLVYNKICNLLKTYMNVTLKHIICVIV